MTTAWLQRDGKGNNMYTQPLRRLYRKPLRYVPIINVLCAGFSSAALLVPHTAISADLPFKAPPASTYNWTGCYLGVNGGGAASGSDFSTNVGPGTHLTDPGDIGPGGTVGTAGTFSHNDSNYLLGGQTGCNWQTGTLVFGLEGDIDYFHSHPGFINNTNTLNDGVTPFTVSQTLTTDYLASVRPRVGIAADRNLAYITGGAAFTSVNYTQTYFDVPNGGSVAFPGTGSATASKSLVGWVVGAGWEYAWSEHWTFKLEYLFAGFPKTNGLGSITDTAGNSNSLQGSADLTIQTARAGVNFKF
jgi:outer membrane immunogenic protein